MSDNVPPLLMEKRDLDSIPSIAEPEGYRLRTFLPGDEQELARLYSRGALGAGTAAAVREQMLAHPCFSPERIAVAAHGSELAATAAAWREPETPGLGFLHMVSVAPEHRRQGLGVLVCAAALRYSAQEGVAAVRLLTDDWRGAALRLYVSLGFRPLCVDAAHAKRWRRLAEKLGLSEFDG